MTWYDNNLYSLPDLVKTVTLKYGDGEYDFDRFTGMKNTQFMTQTPDYPKEGSFLAGWYDEEGNEADLTMELISEDRVFTAKYIPESEVVRVKEIYFSDLHPIVDIDEDAFANNYSIYPLNAQDQNMIKWTSSDETVAAVSEDGNLFKLKSTGKTTITAHLYDGEEFSYELTVFDDTAVPESLDVTEDSIELTVGGRGMADFRIFPENAKSSTINYNMEMIEGENVIDIDMNGMITARSPGKAKVTVCAVTYVKQNDSMEMKTVFDSFEVVVKAPPKKEVKVSAVRNDGDNKDSIRPSSAIITFFVSGDFYGSAEIYESTNWEALLYVPVNAEITTRVFKNDAITGTDGEGSYSYEITGSADEGFVVTFTHTSKEDESSEDDSSEPETPSEGSNPDTGAPVSVFAASLALAAAAASVISRKRK